MEPDENAELDGERSYCPECGVEETGYFCRNCGTLLRGEDRVLCPRCHAIVPAADYCPRCGQGLKGMALNLEQLAAAGQDFWVAGSGAAAAAALPEEETVTWDLGQAATLPASELPDWLRELPKAQAPPAAQERVYPALRPLEDQPPVERPSRYLSVVIVLMAAILIGLVAVAVFFVMQGTI